MEAGRYMAMNTEPDFMDDMEYFTMEFHAVQACMHNATNNNEHLGYDPVSNISPMVSFDRAYNLRKARIKIR